jgi:DNA-binding SARP family transcriptional activator
LLAYLVVETGPHPREKLTAMFWPDSDPRKGRAALRYTLAALRRALGEAEASAHLRIARDSVGFAGESDFELDLPDLDEVTGARSLVNAAARWRGEFLEGFSLSDAPGFDEWTSVQREHWHRRAEVIFEGLARAQADSGARADAADTLGRWIAMSPLSEAAHRQLIELHLAAGEPTAALRAYEACRNTLSRELGTAPDPRTQAMLERIRGTPSADQPPTARHDSTGLVEGPLVGRSNEFVRLVESYHAARQGSGRVAVVRGEAGIGKTRLAGELAAWATGRGGDVLNGRAFQAGGRLPYQPLVDALRPRIERENAPEDLLSDVWLAELSRLLPELRERYPDLPPLAPDEMTTRTRLYEAVVRLVESLA